MTLRRCAAVSAAFLALIHAAAHAQAQGGASSAAAPAAQTVDVQGGRIRVVTVATGLVHPWMLEKSHWSRLPRGRAVRAEVYFEPR